MESEATRWVVLGAVALFAVYIVAKSLGITRARPLGNPEARRRLADAKQRARDGAAGPELRATAWQDAARVALEELGRPNLAASYAVRALTTSGSDPETVRLLATALRRARRHRALEKWLWRRLAEGPGPAYDRAYAELVALYEGPMRRPQWASALRSLRPPAA